MANGISNSTDFSPKRNSPLGFSRTTPASSDSLERAVGATDEILASNGVDRYVCNREGVTLPCGTRLLVRGWVVGASAHLPAREVRAFVDGAPFGTTYYGYPRDDVAAALGNADVRLTGYRVVIDTTQLAAGSHELRVAVPADDARGRGRELEPITFNVAARATRAFPASTPGLFAFDLTSFHGENRPPSRLARIERPFVANVTGRIRDVADGTRPAAVYGMIDGFDTALSCVAKSGDFIMCFSSDVLAYGKHELSIVATDERERLETVANIGFSVVPMSCDRAVPFAEPEPALAHVAWADPVMAPGSPATFDSRDVACIRGWVLDPLSGDAAGAAFLRFNDERTIRLHLRQYRDDCSDQMARFSGFVGSIAMSAFPAGEHVARIVMESKDQRRMHEAATTLRFRVRE